MKIVVQSLIMVFSISMFLSAFAINLNAMQTVEKFQNTVEDKISVNQVLSTGAPNDSSRKVLLSYEELCGRMMYPIPCDFKIDDTVVECETYDPDLFDFSIIKKKQYRQTYQYSSDGTIQMMIFTSL